MTKEAVADASRRLVSLGLHSDLLGILLLQRHRPLVNKYKSSLFHSQKRCAYFAASAGLQPAASTYAAAAPTAPTATTTATAQSKFASYTKIRERQQSCAQQYVRDVSPGRRHGR